MGLPGGTCLVALLLWGSASAFHPPRRTHTPGVPSQRLSECTRLATSSRENMDDLDPTELEELRVFNAKKKKIRDNRDFLPYEVSVISPPPQRSLGVFSLDKHTTSGDVIEAGVGSGFYEIRRVRCLYKYRAGYGFQMTRKLAETVEVNRAAQEAFFGRVIQMPSAEEVYSRRNGTEPTC